MDPQLRSPSQITVTQLQLDMRKVLTGQRHVETKTHGQMDERATQHK